MSRKSERVREWARHKVRAGKCRENMCSSDVVSETPEGVLCLEHYVSLPSCQKCGQAASGGASLCHECERGEDSVVLVRSSLSYHDEVPGHDVIGGPDANGLGTTYIKKKVLGQGPFKGQDLLKKRT